MSRAVVFCASISVCFFGSSSRMIEKTHEVDRISDDIFFPEVNTHDVLEYPAKIERRVDDAFGSHEYPEVSRRRISPSGGAYGFDAYQRAVQGSGWLPNPDSENYEDGFYRHRRSPKISRSLYNQGLMNKVNTPRTTTPKKEEDHANETEYIDAYIPEIQKSRTGTKNLSGIVSMYKINRQSADKDQKGNTIYRRSQKRSTTTVAPVLYADEPKDLYNNALTPGVVFRVILAEAILKMQYRNYQLDADASVVEADTEFLRLARKVVADELDSFAQLRRLVEGFARHSELVNPHTCNVQYTVHGVPWTNFTTPEEHMKRWCLFEAVFLDRVSYVVGADKSLIAAVAPPILQCDAATCNAVPFVDAMMFEQKLQATRVRKITRCQAECRTRCTNHPGCLEKCNAECEDQRA